MAFFLLGDKKLYKNGHHAGNLINSQKLTVTTQSWENILYSFPRSRTIQIFQVSIGYKQETMKLAQRNTSMNILRISNKSNKMPLTLGIKNIYKNTSHSKFQTCFFYPKVCRDHVFKVCLLTLLDIFAIQHYTKQT